MSIYLNPGCSGFEAIRKTEYVDKSGLIGLINRSIGTRQKLMCVSRPRRFGKSYAAQMLCAYYCRSCNTRRLFDDLAIAEDSTYLQHINQYNVLYIDITSLKPYSEQYQTIRTYLTRKISEELASAWPALQVSDDLSSTLIHAAALSGTKFIMIIDEWDAPIRENPDTGWEYLEFLHSLFKSSRTTSRVFAAVYMTGILPIKKDDSQPALSDFEEFSMLHPYTHARYIGFTESEVQSLCMKRGAAFSDMKRWYGGYSFRDTEPIYNPYSVMKAIKYKDFRPYWTETSATESLKGYISMSYPGLPKMIADLIDRIEVPLDPTGFANDLATFRGADDILTLLVHLGYLSYDPDHASVHIPNEEIWLEFSKAVREVYPAEALNRLQDSNQLFYDTIHGNEAAAGS